MGVVCLRPFVYGEYVSNSHRPLRFSDKLIHTLKRRTLNMTTRQQLAQQLKDARVGAGISLRALSALVNIPTTTIEGYEKGNKIPADAFLRIADALEHPTFNIDNYNFEVSRTNGRGRSVAETADQMKFNFSGQHQSSRATVKIGPGRITVSFDANKTTARKG